MHVLYIYIWQRIKSIGLVTGLGGHFATKDCSRRGCSATNPSATSPLKTTVLCTGPRQGFVTEHPRQRFVTKGGGPATTRVLIHSHVYIYIYIHMRVSYTHLSLYFSSFCQYTRMPAGPGVHLHILKDCSTTMEQKVPKTIAYTVVEALAPSDAAIAGPFEHAVLRRGGRTGIEGNKVPGLHRGRDGGLHELMEERHQVLCWAFCSQRWKGGN